MAGLMVDPVDCCGIEHRVSEVLVEVRQVDALVEDPAVDERKGRELPARSLS